MIERGNLMKKGFTLIELLAVIIILAIVALIATPIVLDVVDDARTSAAKSEASMIVSGVNNYCAAADMQEQLNGTKSICKDADGVTKEEVAIMVDLGNTKINNITYDGKVTSLEVESNTKVVTYDGSTYKIDGEVVEIPDVPDTPPAPTYAAYSIGEEITLIDGTTWFVIKDSTDNESEIKIISKSNIRSSLTAEIGIEMFGSYVLQYDSNNSNVWANSSLKAYLEGTVKERLEVSLNTTISDITIWGAEELEALGCTVRGNETTGYSYINCNNAKQNYSEVFGNEPHWTKIPLSGETKIAWITGSNGNFNYDDIGTRNVYGARPIITVSKDVIRQ